MNHPRPYYACVERNIQTLPLRLRDVVTATTISDQAALQWVATDVTFKSGYFPTHMTVIRSDQTPLGKALNLWEYPGSILSSQRQYSNYVTHKRYDLRTLLFYQFQENPRLRTWTFKIVRLDGSCAQEHIFKRLNDDSTLMAEGAKALVANIPTTSNSIDLVTDDQDRLKGLQIEEIGEWCFRWNGAHVVALLAIRILLPSTETSKYS